MLPQSDFLCKGKKNFFIFSFVAVFTATMGGFDGMGERRFL